MSMEPAEAVRRQQALQTRSPGELFFNRDLSWLEFNARVLEEAWQPATPLLDRLKFLSIFSSNQDEFFMVRVAGLKKMQQEGLLPCESPDKKPIPDLLKVIQQRCNELIRKQYECFHSMVLPALEHEEIKIFEYADLSTSQKEAMNLYFQEEVFPVLTPLAVDPSHPYPFLSNLSLYLLVEFYPTSSVVNVASEQLIGFVEIPAVIPRLIPLDRSAKLNRFVLLESVVKAHLRQLFLGFNIKDSWMVRVTRNLDYTLLESRVVDLLEAIQNEVINRIQPEAVRLEVDEKISPSLAENLRKILRLDENDVYYVPTPLHLSSFNHLYSLPLTHLKQPEFNPRIPARLATTKNIFSLLREKDLLVHHPFESFYVVIELLNTAALDPDVYAIKQTLYRSSGDSPIIEALIKAAENGKQVTAVVELKARFDEKNNVVWARRLERAGVHVVYGFVGLKTHCKATLVVRKERNKLVRYMHLSTGNYNSQTARQYTDLGLLTADQEVGKDISALFNLLTGFNILKDKGSLISEEAVPKFHKITVSPLALRVKIFKEITNVISEHKKYGDGLIMIKINGLDDKAIIEKLYQASAEGVQVKLIVRGICCIKPGVVGLSENIAVISIVDQFLEHSRIYYFRAAGLDRVFLGSADWMTRNMDRRIEIMYPIEDPNLKDRLITEILHSYWQDNTKARELQVDGRYTLRQPQEGQPVLRVQQKLIDLVRMDGIKSLPYDKAIRYHPPQRGGRPLAAGVVIKRKKT